MDERKVIFIAGPMGAPEQRARFKPAAEKFESEGWNVINPEKCIPHWMEREEALPICFAMIDKADTVYFYK